MKSGDELPVGVSPIPGVALMPAVAVMVAVLSDATTVEVTVRDAVTLMAGVALLPSVVVGVMVRVAVALIAGVADMVAVPVTAASVAMPAAKRVGDTAAVTVRDGVGVDVWPAAMSGVAPARSTRVAVAETGGVAVICLPPAMVAPAVAEAVIAATVALTGDAVSVAGAAVGDGSTTAVAVTAVCSVWREPAFRVADGGTAATAVFVETPVAPLAATSVALEVALIVAAGRTGALLERVGAIVGGVPSPWPRGVAVADGVSVAVAVIVGETGRGSEAQFASIPVSVLSEITL